MKVNFTSLSETLSSSLRIIGNLPYNISVSLLLYLFKYIDVIQDMHFMLQKEVANRLLALPGNKDYGRLSIIAQYFCKIIPIMTIAPTSFKPIPKVDSTLVKLEPYINKPYKVIDLTQLMQLTKIAFNQRRKIVSNSLKTLFNSKELIKHDINIASRAENLSIKQYCYLANILTNRSMNKFS